MKAVVIQEPIAQPDLTPQELTARWQALAALPGVDEVTILTPPAYPSAAEIGALAADADALFGVWIGPDLINADFLAHHPGCATSQRLAMGGNPLTPAWPAPTA